MSKFLSDTKIRRQRARRNIEQGPVMAGYKAAREKAIAVLNEDLLKKAEEPANDLSNLLKPSIRSASPRK